MHLSNLDEAEEAEEAEEIEEAEAEINSHHTNPPPHHITH